MKINRQAKRRAARRLGDVVRFVHHSHNDYRWWRYQETEPAEGYVVDNWTERLPAYPRAAAAPTRKSPGNCLSRSQLRRRLYQRHVPKPQWSAVLAKYAGLAMAFGPENYPTFKGLKKTSGYAVAKAVTRNVRRVFVILDEYGFYLAPGMAEFAAAMRSDRKVGSGHLVTQTLPPGFVVPTDVAQLLDEQAGTELADAERFTITQSLADFGGAGRTMTAPLAPVLEALRGGLTDGDERWHAEMAAVTDNPAIRAIGRVRAADEMPTPAAAEHDAA